MSRQTDIEKMARALEAQRRRSNLLDWFLKMDATTGARDFIRFRTRQRHHRNLQFHCWLHQMRKTSSIHEPAI